MLDNVSFRDIDQLGEVMYETDDFIHVQYEKMITRYDSNYIEWKKTPTLKKFKEGEQYIKENHQMYQMNYMNFHFPEGTKIKEDVHKYLLQRKYDISTIELYAIQAENFQKIQIPKNVTIQKVDNSNIDVFLQLQYEDDIEYGIKFAQEQRNLSESLYKKGFYQYLLAYEGEVPVGYVELIVKKQTVEMNNLMVRPYYRRKYIGTSLQQKMINLFPNKTILLLADYDDTPRYMYREQGYTYINYKNEALLLW